MYLFVVIMFTQELHWFSRKGSSGYTTRKKLGLPLSCPGCKGIPIFVSDTVVLPWLAAKVLPLLFNTNLLSSGLLPTMKQRRSSSSRTMEQRTTFSDPSFLNLYRPSCSSSRISAFLTSWRGFNLTGFIVGSVVIVFRCARECGWQWVLWALVGVFC